MSASTGHAGPARRRQPPRAHTGSVNVAHTFPDKATVDNGRAVVSAVATDAPSRSRANEHERSEWRRSSVCEDFGVKQWTAPLEPIRAATNSPPLKGASKTRDRQSFVGREDALNGE